MTRSSERYAELQLRARGLREALPEAMAGFSRLHRAALEPGALDLPTKELIALAIAVTVRCEGCVSFHLADALRAGASRAQIVEALGVAVLMGGGPAVVTGAEALATLDALEASPKLWMRPADGAAAPVAGGRAP